MEMQTDKTAKCPKKSLNDKKKSHSCNQSNFTINRLSSLGNHTRLHSGEKPFVCTQCESSANQSSTLRRHTLPHSGEKPSNCRQCNHSCNNRSTLKNHMLTHIGGNPSVAHNVASPAKDLLISGHTYRSTQVPAHGT